MKCRSLLSALAIVVVTLGLLEAATRMLHRSDALPPHLQAYTDVARAQGYPEDALARHIETYRTSGTPAYFDYYIYGNRAGKLPIAEFSDYFGARSTPASVPEPDADCLIWAFGGSTMQNLETTDVLSIANTVAGTLAEQGFRPMVRNLGVGGFQSSLELARFQVLLRLSPQRRPDAAIFYDGYNDAYHGYYFGPGVLQADLSGKLRDLVERNYPRLWLYTFSEWLGERSAFWNRFFRPRIQNRLYGHWTRAQPGDERRAAQIYLDNVQMAEATCEAFGIRCLFVLQPLITSKKNLVGPERKTFETLERFDPKHVEFVRAFYSLAREKLAGNPAFLDLSGALDNRTVPDFYDLGHTGPYTGREIGRLIGERVARAGCGDDQRSLPR